MEGDLDKPDRKGIIPRAVEDIFNRLGAITSDASVKISSMELYNEQLEDLLLNDKTSRGVVGQNLSNVLVKSADDIYKHLDTSLAKRKVSATQMNKQSNRAHFVFTIAVHMKETTPEGEELLKVGKLNVVDLAGSECVGRSVRKSIYVCYLLVVLVL
jgi:kinesin family protein 11